MINNAIKSDFKLLLTITYKSIYFMFNVITFVLKYIIHVQSVQKIVYSRPRSY
jgi:hypothetical protein